MYISSEFGKYRYFLEQIKSLWKFQEGISICAGNGVKFFSINVTPILEFVTMACILLANS
jgi:hypothetical protein